MDQWEAEGVIKRFYEEKLITRREFQLLKAIVSRETLAIDLPERDMIRGRIIKAVLTTLCRKD